MTNLTEEIWDRLKSRAKGYGPQAAPTHEECAAFVRRVCAELTRDENALPSHAVEFYAKEMLAMIDARHEHLEGKGVA